MGNFSLSKIQKIIVFCIFILAIFLRFYKLGQIPPSLTWDEAALGYNAYSILKTGKDEYGISFPLTLRSFGDYKPPLYTYLTIPSIWAFGLNEFAVRFPSALFGSLTVVVTYFLVRELFRLNKTRSFLIKTGSLETGSFSGILNAHNLALISSFLLAISPWHIQFSRGAFEANLGLFLVLLGTYLFLRASRKNFLLLVSSLVFSLSLFAYHSLRVFTPLLALSLVFLYKKEIFKMKKWLVVSFLIGVIFLVPFVKTLSGEKTLARFSGVSAFADPGLLSRSIKKIEEDQSSFLARVLHNRRIVYATIFLINYLSHFDPNFLFVRADDNPRHHAPANGLLYFWEMITIPVGFFALSKLKGKGRFIVFSFLLLAPIAAAPTKASPHAIRSLNSLPAYIIISSIGLAYLFAKTKKLRSLLVISIFGNFIFWSNLYFIHLPLETSQAWQFGYKQVVEEVSFLEKNYDQVIVTGKYDQPYIFFLFFKKYDPKQYQTEYGNPQELPRYERTFGKYHFLEKINLSEIKKEERVLIVATEEEVGEREDFKTLKTIDFLDGSLAFLIGEKI